MGFSQLSASTLRTPSVIERNHFFYLCSLFVFILVAQTYSFRSLCVYTNWAQYKAGKGHFEPEHIDTSLCTHIVYDLAVPEGLNIRALEGNDESNEWRVGMYARVNKLKEKSRRLKVLLSVGGPSFDAHPFQQIAQTETSRSTFVNNAVAFLRKNNFDGINIAWYFLGRDGYQVIDKENFQLLIEDFRTYFDIEHKFSGRIPLILSVMVPGRKDLIEQGLQVAKLANFTDFVNIYTCELPAINPEYVDYNFPVYLVRKQGKIDNSELTLDWIAQYYVSLGMPKTKINIALPTFARSYILKNASQHSVLSPVDGLGLRTNFTLDNGVLAYYEVCDMIKEGAKVFREPFHDGVYAVLEDTWVGFENVDTITKKACYASLHEFGGVMFYSLDSDDFTGESCNQGRYPLIAAAFMAMANTTRANCSDYYIMAPDIHVTIDNPKTTPTVPTNNEDTEDENPELKKPRIVCYFTMPTPHSSDPDKLQPEHINANMCTHISYSYADVQGLKITLPSGAKPGEGIYERLFNLKLRSPDIKILLAVKGSSVGSESFLLLVKKDYVRFTFAMNTASFLRKNNFDGFDIFWENTGDQLNIPSNVLRFHLLVHDLKRAFDVESNRSGKSRLILSLALQARRENIESSFDVIKLTEWTDFISLKTFDFHGSWETCVGFNAPLLAGRYESGNNSLLNVDAFVRYFLSKGGDVKRINIGISTYAVSFTLSNPKQFDMLSPASKPGVPGPVTETPGILAFYEVCQLIQNGAKVHYEPYQHNRYVVSGDQWVGYDDKTSVYRKVCYAHLRGIKGLMIYALEYDDFSGQWCSQGKFPLLTTAYITLMDRTCPGSNELGPLFATSQASRLSLGDTFGFWITLLWGIWKLGTLLSSFLTVYNVTMICHRFPQEHTRLRL